ncbi:GTP-binding protein At3g49725, chloroplastic [Juglans microcarpa x Juglans regia]|uniref:GTP-binding protein At3g49725, chloroplastic n=1 Tax=Juglans microcarpa x Juglans regia TaxID=2249226 RepID=UPI001B7DBFD0|nr:GTP-binding protein At3g49725, chloroplastic [Juglans microcarpa x Juglans regia]
MIRPISLGRILLRSLTQTLTSSLCSNPPHPPFPSTPQALSSPSFRILTSRYSYSSKQNKDEANDLVSLFNRDTITPPKLFVVQPRLRPDTFLQAKLNEALCLANSLEEQRDGYFDTDFFEKALPPHVVVQNPAAKAHMARADTYFGPGTVETIKCTLYGAESKGKVDAVFVNTILSGVQQRNLERAWDKPVLDRVGLIIEIFNAHAFTKEAKLQAELAALTYKKTRLVRIRGLDGRFTFGATGEAEVVSARGRGSGGRGFISGAGETELQLQRRRILERRNSLLAQIEEVRRTRALQRAARKRHGGGQGLETVAVIGYTNAGKSTLVGALSDSDLYSDARLFATVDPRLRSVILPSGRKVLFSDTVGFISDLPVQLVDAFHATLEEVVEADLLVHVLDCTAPNLDEHRSTVLQVLQQLGVSEEKLQNMIEVWNKIDYQEEGVDDGEDGDSSSISGDEDDVASDLSMAEQIVDYDDDNMSEQSPENLADTLDDEPSDHSDGWLHEETTGKEILSGRAGDVKTNEPSKDCIMDKDLSSQGLPGAHIRTSAITGVGLQELLELIDEKLRIQDEKMKAEQGVEKGIFHRKWRPPRAEDAGIAVEQ